MCSLTSSPRAGYRRSAPSAARLAGGSGMKCPRCQYENPPQAKFCLECGARVALTCTKCRSELPVGAKFCLECGAPVAHEDHGVRACYAALQMQGAVGGYAGDLRRSQGLDVQIRIGLNSGEVVVRSIGSDLRMDYTAVGQTTHLAARMEQLAQPGTTLMTGDTLRLCEERVQVNPLGPMPIKGLGEPVEVYEVTGAGAARTRFQAAAAPGLTSFVGRDAEMEQLRAALEGA